MNMKEKVFSQLRRSALDLDKIESNETKESESENADKSDKFKVVIEKATKVLGSSVKEVRLSNRLTDSACCLISDEHDVSGHLERLLKSAGQSIPERKPILEINPNHPLVEQLFNESEQGGEA